MTRFFCIALVWLGAACGGTHRCPESTPPPVRARAPAPPPAHEPMTAERLGRIVRSMGSDARGDGRVWQLTYGGVELLVVTDPAADRMRIVAPVLAEAAMSEEQRRLVMAANFHTALDARYATSQGVLYAAFIHPLSPLGEEEVRSGLRQVARLASTFGSSYSSGELVFGAAP